MGVGLGCGKRELENRSPGLVRHRPEPATVREHDRAADGQSHSHPIGFGGEKGIEDPIRRLGFKARPRIADLDEDLVRPFAPAGDRQLARRDTRLAHRLDSIADEIQHDCRPRAPS